MKYRILLSTLRILVYIKRGIWWIGSKIGQGISTVWSTFWGIAGLIGYKLGYFLKRLGFGRARQWFTKRAVFQIGIFIFLFAVSWSHTKFSAGKDLVLANQKTIVYRLFAPSEDYGVEEVLADTRVPSETDSTWREAALVAGSSHATGIVTVPERDVATIVAGGAAFTKPILIPGTDAGRATRTAIAEYMVEAGDSLGTIAQDFGVSVATILWENKLTPRSIIRPGDVLRIPPTTGVMYIVKKGDTVKKIAALYSANQNDIIAFNNLDTTGGLKSGGKIMVPNGVPPNTPASVLNSIKKPIIVAVGPRVAAPPSSTYAPSASGFIWPSGAHTITQYFSWKHNALDIAGPWQTPTYAAKAGVVEKAQCGWNGGYGCYVVIDHGGGIKTLYAHHSQLLVTAGEHVEQGQTIALMGNSGNVRGITGIHMHFEVIVNGVRVNGLGYVHP